MYPPELVKPMREDLTNIGFEELHTVEQVDEAIARKGTTLVVVNSVCGCAAANARPAARISLQNSKTPDNLVTVFAGVDKEATEKARDYMVPFPLLPHRWPCLEMVSWSTCWKDITLKVALQKLSQIILLKLITSFAKQQRTRI